MLAVAELLSVTVTFTLKGLPVLVEGVSVIAPIFMPMPSAVGKPVADQVYPPAPPVAVMLAVYDTPTVPIGKGAGPDIASGTPVEITRFTPMAPCAARPR
jgi:hypothetical protein